MNIEKVEPFIILPYGRQQDIVFFINKEIRNTFDYLVDMAYKDLANEVLENNLIKVVDIGKRIIVFHIFTTTFNEKFSNRKGQFFTVGFIIEKIFLKKKYEIVMNASCLFFEAIICCGGIDRSDRNIPTQFVYRVNELHYNRYIIDKLNDVRNQIIEIIHDEKMVKCQIPDQRLRKIYSFIKENMKWHKEYWIVVNKEENKRYMTQRRIYYLDIGEEQN